MPKITVNVDQAQLDAWKEAAWSHKVSLSQWVRLILDANAAKAKESRGDH